MCEQTRMHKAEEKKERKKKKRRRRRRKEGNANKEGKV